ncbi:MAG TPA: histidine kinase [Ferruginibacter sp.]|nr:histidine kinase [Ferruginibacter sp.]HPH92424.1 histidine kinase [Ferruginibacter sp.]
MRYLYKKVIAAVLVLIASAAYSQNNCKCDLYDSLSKSRKTKSALIADLSKEKSTICQALAMELKGESLIFDKDDLDAAEICLRKAEEIYRKTNCGEGVLWNTYKQRFQVYWNRSDFPNAQEYGLKFLQSAEKINSVYDQAIANTMIAIVFYKTNQFEKGLVFNDKAAELLPKITESKKRQKILYFLSVRYMAHYLATKSTASIQKSLTYNLQHLALSKELKDTVQFARSYFNLSGTEEENKNWNKAMVYLDSGYLFINKKDTIDLWDYYANKSSLYIELKNSGRAILYADSALICANALEYKLYIAESQRIIAEAANLTGDYKKAYTALKTERMLRDSINNIERTKVVAELEKKYNQAKNENTIKDLDKKKQLYLFLAIAAILTATTIGFFLRQQNLKHKQNILETEQRLNRARMNPHFFFNALTALQKFALRDNDGQAMASNLSKFSNIMRETLESTYKEYVTIEQEMEFLNQYLEVQKIRFPQTFSYEVTAAKDLDIDELQIPAMIIQPFVENSIEHGFVGVEYPGKITVNFMIENKELQIQITDNGKGLDTTIKEKNEHISRASQIIKDRIYLLNIKLKTKAGFGIDNNSSGNGVIVKIHLPLLYKENKS